MSGARFEAVPAPSGEVLNRIIGNAQLVNDEAELRDEGDGEWPAGLYQLVVDCSGNGRFRMVFRAGAATLTQEVPSCAPGGSVSSIGLRIEADGAGHSLVITAVEDAEAVVAYAVRRW